MSKTFSMTIHAGGLFLASAKPEEVRHMPQEQAEKKNPALRHYGSIRVGLAGHNEE
ncbi:MAG: hypothetical protein Q8R89_05435 [Desulfomicrobium sp.]|nr:hypothetical protein [Desulfomicrobium sp.]